MNKHPRTVVQKAADEFLKTLEHRNASRHTIKAYRGDLDNFASYARSRDWKSIDHVAIRGFLSQLYEKGLDKTSVARSLAAVRSLYRWLAQEGVVEQNPAALVTTPKLPKKLPRVPTIEEMNTVLDGEMPDAAAFPERDRLILELLYGCGIRNSELTGIKLDDIRLSAEAILIRGKGKKERYVPFGESVRGTLAAYLPVSEEARSRHAVLDVSSRRSRSQRAYPPTFTHTRYVTRLELTCWRKAPICARSRKCSVMNAFRPPSVTRSFPSSMCCRFTIRRIRGRSNIEHLALSI